MPRGKENDVPTSSTGKEAPSRSVGVGPKSGLLLRETTSSKPKDKLTKGDTSPRTALDSSSLTVSRSENARSRLRTRSTALSRSPQSSRSPRSTASVCGKDDIPSAQTPVVTSRTRRGREIVSVSSSPSKQVARDSHLKSDTRTLSRVGRTSRGQSRTPSSKKSKTRLVKVENPGSSKSLLKRRGQKGALTVDVEGVENLPISKGSKTPKTSAKPLSPALRKRRPLSPQNDSSSNSAEQIRERELHPKASGHGSSTFNFEEDETVAPVPTTSSPPLKRRTSATARRPVSTNTSTFRPKVIASGGKGAGYSQADTERKSSGKRSRGREDSTPGGLAGTPAERFAQEEGSVGIQRWCCLSGSSSSDDDEGKGLEDQDSLGLVNRDHSNLRISGRCGRKSKGGGSRGRGGHTRRSGDSFGSATSPQLTTASGEANSVPEVARNPYSKKELEEIAALKAYYSQVVDKHQLRVETG